MLKLTKISFLLAMVATIAACQKAKMKSVRPAPISVQQVAPAPAPMPTLNQSQIAQGQNQVIIKQNDNIKIGPDPKLPEFQPSPATPIEDDGLAVDENIFSQNSQQGVEPNLQGENVVEWFEHSYVEPSLCKCGDIIEPELPPPPTSDKGMKQDERLACKVVVVEGPMVNKKEQNRMEYRNYFLCKTNIDVNEIDEKTFKITVIDSKNKTLGSFSIADRTATAKPVTDKNGKTEMEVTLDYARLQKISQPNMKVKMNFIRLQD